MWARDLTDQEKAICQALGEVVIGWNHVEQSFRILLHRATHIGGPDGRLWSLIGHLSPIQLKDSMIALSTDHDDFRKMHLIHCAKYFDRMREYRNFYVHGPRTFWSTNEASELVASSLSVRGGGLNLRQSKIKAEDLLDFRETLGDLQAYLGELIEDSINLRGGKPLSELSMPNIPPALPVEKLSWWDLARPQA